MPQLNWVTVAALFVALLLVAGVGGKLLVKPPQNARTQFSEAAASLGISEKKRIELRGDFERAMDAFLQNTCDENLRNIVGVTAVDYYETLLEKPFSKAKLYMTSSNVCAVRPNGELAATDPLAIAERFQRRLRLPWDCMPDDWRTPVDLALQSKLEASIHNGTLTSGSFTGTLALLAMPWEKSPQRNICRVAQPAMDRSRPNLPVLAAPRDSWSEGSRRRRY